METRRQKQERIISQRSLYQALHTVSAKLDFSQANIQQALSRWYRDSRCTIEVTDPKIWSKEQALRLKQNLRFIAQSSCKATRPKWLDSLWNPNPLEKYAAAKPEEAETEEDGEEEGAAEGEQFQERKEAAEEEAPVVGEEEGADEGEEFEEEAAEEESPVLCCSSEDFFIDEPKNTRPQHRPPANRQLDHGPVDLDADPPPDSGPADGPQPPADRQPDSGPADVDLHPGSFPADAHPQTSSGHGCRLTQDLEAS